MTKTHFLQRLPRRELWMFYLIMYPIICVGIYIFNYNLTTVQSGHLQFLYIFYILLTNTVFPEGIFLSYIFLEGGGGVIRETYSFIPDCRSSICFGNFVVKKKISTKTIYFWILSKNVLKLVSVLNRFYIFFLKNCTNIICFAIVLITFYLLV